MGRGLLLSPNGVVSAFLVVRGTQHAQPPDGTNSCLQPVTCAHDIDLMFKRDHPVVLRDGVIYAEQVSAFLTLVVHECNLERVAHKAKIDYNWAAQRKARVQTRALTRTRERRGLQTKGGACDTERRLQNE